MQLKVDRHWLEKRKIYIYRTKRKGKNQRIYLYEELVNFYKNGKFPSQLFGRLTIPPGASILQPQPVEGAGRRVIFLRKIDTGNSIHKAFS